MQCAWIGVAVVATASVASAADAADANFVFFPTVEYSVSIKLDNELRCNLPPEATPPDGTKCTISFDGSTSHTFDVDVANGYHESFAFSPGMPVHETCLLSPINHQAGLDKMIRCGDADEDDDWY